MKMLIARLSFVVLFALIWVHCSVAYHGDPEPVKTLDVRVFYPHGIRDSPRAERLTGRGSLSEAVYDENQHNADIQRVEDEDSDTYSALSEVGGGELTGVVVKEEGEDELEESSECCAYEYQKACAKMHGRRVEDVPLPRPRFNCRNIRRNKRQPPENAKRKRPVSRRRKRLTAIITGQDITWDLGYIPFNFTSPMIFTNTYPNNVMGRIRAMNHYHYWTCLRFLQWTPTLHLELGLNHNNYLDHRLTETSGCSSVLGNRGEAGQTIHTCWDNAAVHEYGHALGQAHEHRNTLGRDEITVNFENMAHNSKSQFTARDVYSVTDYDGYDLTSQMHYNIYDGSNNGRKVFTVHDPDDEFLITKDDPYDYYLMFEVSTTHNCIDLVCRDFTLMCQNGGYVSYIRDKCTCRCPDGLDPATGCTTKYDGDRTLVNEGWPWGSFTLLATEIYDGCPKGFYRGSLTHRTKYFDDDKTSAPSNGKVAYGENNGENMDIHFGFCTKRFTADNGQSPDWPKGHYCIYRSSGTCPEGFTSGNICYGESLSAKDVIGDVPDGNYSTSYIIYEFCCRKDSDVDTNTTLSLPNDTPFILFQSKSGCHPIEGMTHTEQWFKIKTPGLILGMIPRKQRGALYYCYYRPVSYDTTLDFSLWPQEPFTILSTEEGCPGGFLNGQFTEYSSKFSLSDPFTISSTLDSESKSLTHSFCTKEASASIPGSTSWMPGQYCFLASTEICPDDFERGSVEFEDSAPPNEISGVLPDSNLTTTTVFHFCCREDGFARNPIILPTSEPFTLFPVRTWGGRQCQNVQDMTVSDQYYTIKSISVVKTGIYPHMTESWDTHHVHVCVYYPTKYDCGGVINMNGSNPEISIESPNDGTHYLTERTCFWNIMSPPGSRILMNFDYFNLMENDDGTCDDCLEIRNKKPGYFGECFCGNFLKHTIVSDINWAALTFYSSISHTRSGFRVRLTLTYDTDKCFIGKGETYRGTVNYTKRNYKCLNWTEVTHCAHHPYRPDDLDDDLISNYCRNPGDGTRPWCYTQSDGCKRDYCDVCGIERCYNEFFDCADRLAENPWYCENDPEAFRGCRKMCNYCAVVNEPSAHEKSCGEPILPHDADPIGQILTSYSYGDKVTFVCKDDDTAIQTRTCLSDGTWSLTNENGGFVCGRCPDGWTPFGLHCYKWFNVQEDRPTAQQTCASANAHLASIRNEEHNEFLRRLTPGAKRFWIGLMDGVWEEDGSPVQFTKYDWGQWYSCAYMLSATGTWIGVDCNAAQYLGFFCSFPMKGRRTNQDSSLHCQDMIRENPKACNDHFEFAHNVCPYSCGLSYNVEPYRTSMWPEGPFSLIGTTLGCPDDMLYVSLLQTSLWATLKDQSDIHDADVIKTSLWSWPLYKWTDETEYGLCTKNETSGETWPSGKYCILMKGPTCPSGFHPGRIQYDDVDTPVYLHGDSLGYTYEENTYLDFCCRKDASALTEIVLPNDKPFVLFRKGQNCQTVKGMTAVREWSTIMNYKDEYGVSQMGIYGETPVTHEWYNRFYELHYCYYKPQLMEELSCTAPNIPINTIQLYPEFGKTSPNNTVPPGDYVEYACADDHVLVSGEFIRACQIDGTLSGSPPVCQVKFDLILPHNNVSIIPRRFVPWGGYLYTANNTAMRIQGHGVIVAWEFWSQYNGSVTFFVLRQTTGDSYFFTIIGHNHIEETLGYRRRMVNISEVDRIEVQKDDVIGIHYNYPYRGGVPYTPCDPDQHVGQFDNTRRSRFAYTYEDFTVNGPAHEFFDSSSCMILSAKAHILYLP